MSKKDGLLAIEQPVGLNEPDCGDAHQSRGARAADPATPTAGSGRGQVVTLPVRRSPPDRVRRLGARYTGRAPPPPPNGVSSSLPAVASVAERASDGPPFGAGNERHVRRNFATSRALLERMVHALGAAVRQ